jgi:23S rRNA (adenine2503-C2)-methyltransferase
MIALQAVTPDTLAKSVSGVSLLEARKIVSAVHRQGRLPASVRSVTRLSLESVRSLGNLPQLQTNVVYRSRIDPFVKYVHETSDGHVIETVRIPLNHPRRFSVCVSSQAGCALGCAFCATGRIGLHRNLEVWEIVEQVREVHRGLDQAKQQRVHGIVFQGMGEPLSNLDNVITSIYVLSEPSALAIDARNITVCTAGLPSGIRRLAREAPKVRLAVSIGSVRAETRRQLMPVARAYPLAEVLEATLEHARVTGLAPMWALTLLAGINDSIEDAHALAALARSFAEQCGFRPRISIIPFNPIGGGNSGDFSRTDPEKERAFRNVLHEAGLSTHKRYSGGSDVLAACGQLAGAKETPSS